MKKGFVKIHRDIVDWQWYKEPLTALLYIHLIVTVNWEKTTFKGVEMERGERMISYATLANETGLSVQNVRTALSHMITTGEVTKRTKGKYTVISITNYDEFQTSNKVSNSKSNSDSTLKSTTDKEYKEIKEIEEDEEERRASSSVAEVLNLYSLICKSLPSPTTISPDTEANILRAISFYGMDKIRSAFEIIESTPFLSGKVSNWCASISWVFSNGNMDKVLNGQYRDYKTKQDGGDFDADKYSFVINQF